MRVEDLIKSAISDEMNKAMNPALITEIVNKKIERSVDKICKELCFEQLLITHAVSSYLKSYEGKRLVGDCVKNSINVTFN